MITICAWCSKDAPPMHDDGKSATITHGICQQHLAEMRDKLTRPQPAEARQEEETA